MDRKETVKVLSILKVAYPNFYKGLSKDEASAVVNLWHMQLNDVPYDIVCIAINKLIATNVFPPAIAEVKQKITSLYGEAVGELLTDKDCKNKELYMKIADCCRGIVNEPSLPDLLDRSKGRLTLTNETYDKQSGGLPTLQT